jgi:hypothetical protein
VRCIGVLILFADDRIHKCHGGSSARIIDPTPSVPVFLDAAFAVGETDRYIDTENKLAIVLLRRDGTSYGILMTTPDQVAD